MQSPSPWRLGEIQQITRKELSVMNVWMILAAVIEKPPSNSDSTRESFTLAQISNQIVLIVR